MHRNKEFKRTYSGSKPQTPINYIESWYEDGMIIGPKEVIRALVIEIERLQQQLNDFERRFVQ